MVRQRHANTCHGNGDLHSNARYRLRTNPRRPLHMHTAITVLPCVHNKLCCYLEHVVRRKDIVYPENG